MFGLIDGVLRLCYTFRMSEKVSKSRRNGYIGDNPDLWFLYKKCRYIKEYTITKIKFAKVFQDALLSYENNLDDLSIYVILKGVYFEYMDEHDGKGFEVGARIMKEISKALMGDHMVWKIRA